jgi:rhodanese-related sulfurtransferase
MRTLLFIGATLSALSGAWLLWPGAEELAPAVFADRLATTENALLIDVRTAEEFAAGHIPGALNISYTGPTFNWRIDELDTAAPVFLYCGTGVRSAKAGEYVLKKNFASVSLLTGGFTAWRQEKLPQTPPELVPPADLTESTYSRFLDLEHLVIVYFYVPWSKTCRKMGPVLDELAIAQKGKVHILRIDTDTYKHLATELGIDDGPVLHFYENGNLTGILEGPAERDQIEDRFKLEEYTGIRRIPAREALTL